MEIYPLQHFLLYVSFSFFFSVFLFLSYFVTRRHSNPTPAGSHMFYCNWLNCFDKCEGVKTHFSAEPGSYLAASLHTTHTHTHTHTHWYKKQPGIQTQSSVKRKRREKEQQKKSKQTENCKFNVSAVESLTGSGRLANLEMSYGERGCKEQHQENDGIELKSMASLPEDLMLSDDFRWKFKKIRTRKRPTILTCRC